MNDENIAGNLKSVAKGLGTALEILIILAGVVMFLYFSLTIGILYGVLYGFVYCGLIGVFVWAISGALYGLAVLIENSNEQTDLLIKLAEHLKVNLNDDEDEYEDVDED